MHSALRRPLVSEAEFLTLPESLTNKVGLLDGEVYVSPSPTLLHQDIPGRLVQALRTWAGVRAGAVFVGQAPIDMRFAPRHILLPDAFVVLGPVDVRRLGPSTESPSRASRSRPPTASTIPSPGTRCTRLPASQRTDSSSRGLSSSAIAAPDSTLPRTCRERSPPACFQASRSRLGRCSRGSAEERGAGRLGVGVLRGRGDIVRGIDSSVVGMTRAKFFNNGQSQAVRLPREFAFEGKAVFVRRVGDAALLAPASEPWAAFEAALGRSTDAFLDDRVQPPIDGMDWLVDGAHLGGASATA